MPLPTSLYESTRWLPFQNANASTAPAFSVMQVTNTVTLDGDPQILKCDQPSTPNTAQLVVNSPSDVSSSGYGLCATTGPIPIAFDTGSPSLGDSYGAKAGLWTLTMGGAGNFIFLGLYDATNKIGIFLPQAPSATGIPFRNDTGSSVTPYALLIDNGLALDGMSNPIPSGNTYLTSAVAPSMTFSRELLINDNNTVASGANGNAQLGPLVIFAFDTLSGMAKDKVFGIKDGQLTGSLGQPGNLFVRGVVDSSNLYAQARFARVESLVCWITSDISAASGGTPGSGSATIYYDGGAGLVTTGMTLTVFNISTQGVTAGSGKFIDVVWDRDKPIVVVEACST